MVCATIWISLMPEIKQEPGGLSTHPNKQRTNKNDTTTNGRDAKSPRWGAPRPTNTAPFKGAVPELSGKVFVTGPSQAARYDDTYKALLHYFGNKFDHRVYLAFEKKDKDIGLSLLTKPSVPMIKKIVQEATAGDSSVLKGVEKEIINKESEEFIIYQMELKQYISDKTKYNSDIQKCFNIIMGQCSPTVERNLIGDDSFTNIKDTSDSIGLIKLLEKVCYSYRAHEYTPLGTWNVVDKLIELKQPEHVHEVKHYESFKSIVELCKASGINFAVMCSANTNVAIKTLHATGKISRSGTYEDGAYFKLTDVERKAVDMVAEESCLATLFLSLASDKLHANSKQELRNDMVKGEDKYPRTIASTLRFLQYHNLRGKPITPPTGKLKKLRSETAFTQADEDNEEEKDKTPPQKKSSICGKFRDGMCPYKKRHTWKEYPTNK